MNNQLGLFDRVPKPEPVRIDLAQELDAIVLDKDKPGAGLQDLVPQGAVFALTRGYGIRSVHVGRILGLLAERVSTGAPITRDEITDHLSMTWASLQGTMNVLRRVLLVDSRNRITPFGKLAFAASPYLDDFGLLWLLHYLVGSSALLVLWSNLFNLVLLERDEITIHQAGEIFGVLEGYWSAQTVHEKARNEFGGIFKTYTEDLFEPLKVLLKSDTGLYYSPSDTATIPPPIWLSTLLIYRDRYYPGAASLEIPLIIRGHYSPGRILRQNEVSVRRALDTLHNAGLLTVETRSGLDQVRFKREYTWLSAAALHLQGEDAG